MPIFELAPIANGDRYAPRPRNGVVSHLGLVLEVSSAMERIMSDVWDYTTYATVWNMAEGRTDKVYLGCSEFGKEREAEVDATPEILAAYQAKIAADTARREAELEAKREQEAQSRIREIKRGHQAIVARGRKVPRGIEGRVFWLGRQRFGWRAGLETEAGETIWIDVANLDRVLPPKPEDMSWQAFEDYLYGIKAAA